MVEYGLRVVSAHDRLSQKAGVSILRRAVQSRGLGYEYMHMYEVSQERTNRRSGFHGTVIRPSGGNIGV